MKIVFTGLPYFSEKLVKELNEFDKKNYYLFFNTYYSFIDRLKFIFHTINADLIVSFNGVSANSKALNFAILLNKKIWMQWHGSDVSIAKKAFKNNTIQLKYINHSKHFTDATWLQKELTEIGINSEIIHFKHVECKDGNKSFITSNILTYMGEGKEAFYGLDIISDFAKKYPSTKIHIVGSSGNKIDTLSENIIFHGWVDKNKMEELFHQNAIFVRLTEHDGNSLSVIEALANGNEVIWSQPHDMTNLANNLDQFEKKVLELQKEITERDFKANIRNIGWARENANKEMVLKKLIEKIEQIAK